MTGTLVRSDTALQAVQECLAEVLQFSVEDIPLHADLQEDVAIDEEQMQVFQLKLEERFDISLEKEEFEKAVSLLDIAELLSHNVELSLD